VGIDIGCQNVQNEHSEVCCSGRSLCVIAARTRVQPIADRVAQHLESISQKKINGPEFCPWDLRLVPSNK